MITFHTTPLEPLMASMIINLLAIYVNSSQMCHNKDVVQKAYLGLQNCSQRRICLFHFRSKIVIDLLFFLKKKYEQSDFIIMYYTL